MRQAAAASSASAGSVIHVVTCRAKSLHSMGAMCQHEREEVTPEPHEQLSVLKMLAAALSVPHSLHDKPCMHSQSCRSTCSVREGGSSMAPHCNIIQP